MLEVESVCVDISRVGRVLDDVTMSAEPGVTVVTGRSGCGSTTLLRLIAGFHDRQVVRRQGVIRLSGRRIDAMSHAELRPQVAVVGHRPTGPLGCNDVECDSAIEQLGLQEWRGRSVARMSACEAARMALAEGIGSGAPVLLLDQLLAPMTSKWRSRAAACVAQMARAGRIVVWAEHALDYALGAADSVVEIIDGYARQVTASSWSSTNLPPTPLQEIAARSGEGVFTSPEQARPSGCDSAHRSAIAPTAAAQGAGTRPRRSCGPAPIGRIDRRACRSGAGNRCSRTGPGASGGASPGRNRASPWCERPPAARAAAADKRATGLRHGRSSGRPSDRREHGAGQRGVGAGWRPPRCRTQRRAAASTRRRVGVRGRQSRVVGRSGLGG